MISVKEAERIISGNCQILPSLVCPLEKAHLRVLREDVFADRDQPPSHRVAMDGIAIKISSLETGQTRFAIEGIQRAGTAALTLIDKNACIEVMTGAELPHGCDCVIPVEEILVNEGQAQLHNGSKQVLMRNIQPKAKDYQKGKRLLVEGEMLSPQHIAVAAAVGKTSLRVTGSPNIAVIGTGDELVEIHQPVDTYQIRRSNAYAIQAALKCNGFFNVTLFHLRDDKRELLDSLAPILEKFHVLILSGGVSMGKFDFIPAVMEKLGVKPLFHKIKQRPGKPLWFGISHDQKPVFGLPGNPVSTQICTYRYVLPYLRQSSGAKMRPKESAVLTESFQPKKELTYFVPVQISCSSDGKWLATPVAHAGSGDYVAMTQAQGFVEFPDGEKSYSPGRAVRLFRWT